VTRVEVLESQPRRVFDRAVVKTLSQWRFNAGTAGRLVEIDVNFAR
jgi:TonB family protein